jgi:hypothetical protein
MPRFSMRTMLAIVAILAIAMALLPPVWRVVSLDWVDDAYALWGAAEMVVEYLDTHDGRWPKGWDDLRPYFDAGAGRVGGGPSRSINGMLQSNGTSIRWRSMLRRRRALGLLSK